MAPDDTRALPQEAPGTAVRDLAVPAPRRPVLEPAADAVPAPRPPAREPTTHDVRRPAGGSRAGWVLVTVVAAGAAWATGWVAGVTWAWHAMTPRYVSRTHPRRPAGLPGV
jgi:hypothetical protein